ncbi:MAG: hydrolase [Acidobacteriota bacterium]|jgi:predicted hydrolase (HD superfamily)|nr:hydrolase [Acidobacteriota bacterium]
MIPTIEQAQAILEKYNREAFHLQHAKIVSETLRHFAKQYDPGRQDYWAVVGLLHDVDFELFPELHCVKGVELLRENDVDEGIVHAAMSHGYGIEQPSGLCLKEHEPTHVMEKILFATDELTGLIGAAALMRPSKSVADMELSSVKKKFKDKKFAAGCSRDVIVEGARRLGWTLDELLLRTLDAMKSIEGACAGNAGKASGSSHG